MSNDMVPAGGMNPLALLQTAIERGLDVDKLGKLMDLAERWEANQAAAAYGHALAKFQSLCPPIKKNRTATIPNKNDPNKAWSYKFADYEDVMKQIGPLLCECGLSVTFSEGEQLANKLAVVCSVRHGSHVQPTHFAVPIPQMLVNDTQRFGAAMSYVKRYALAAALNLVFTGEDNDAAGLLGTITEAEVKVIEDLLEAKNAPRERFMKHLGEVEGRPVASIAEIGRKTFITVVDTLKRMKKQEGKK